MSRYDWLLVIVIAVYAFFAVRSIIRRRKKGGYSGCSGNCSACGGCDKKNE